MLQPKIRRVLLFWAAVAFAVWNGFFDILVSRGEKQYLLSQARYELGLGPRLSIDQIMRGTISDAWRSASIWGLIVFVSGAGSTWMITRR